MDITSPPKTVTVTDLDFYFLGQPKPWGLTLFPDDSFETQDEDRYVVVLRSKQQETMFIERRNTLWVSMRSRQMQINEAPNAKKA